MVATDNIDHDYAFHTENGEPFRTVHLPYNRWRRVLGTMAIWYRKPYNDRHSLISWRLMVGHNRLLVALDDGHNVSTMGRNHAAWIKGSKPEDVEQIKAAMEDRSLKDNVGEVFTISRHSNISQQAVTV